MSRSAVDWSQLPLELLEKIAGTLDEIADRVRFGAVSKPWRSASKSPNLPRVRLPWLLLENPKRLPCMLLEDIDDDEVQSFLSLSDNKIYTLHIPETCKKKYYGSAYGWFLIVDYSGCKQILSLLNPIAKDHILLPPLIAELGLRRKCKVIAMPEGLITMVATKRLMYCYRQRKGADTEVEWTKIRVVDPKGKIPGTVDFTCYGGHYIVLGERGRATLIIDPDTSQTISMIPYVGMDRASRRGFKNSTVLRQYLAESSCGEKLFLVIEHVKTGEKFEVFELCQTERQTKWTWSKVRSIGCNVLFVDNQRAMVLPASHFDGCRGNCIVFFDYDLPGKFEGRWWFDVARFSLFDIGNGGLEQIHSSWHERIKGWANQGWFVPSL